MTEENKKQKENVTWIAMEFYGSIKITVHLFIIVSFIAAMLIIYQSVNGYIDLRGIKNTKNDYFVLKLMYILNIAVVIVFTVVLFIIYKIFKYWKINIDNKYYREAACCIVSLLLLFFGCFLSSLIVVFLNCAAMYEGKLCNNFNENWDPQTIRFVENHYECCMNEEEECKDCREEFFKVNKFRNYFMFGVYLVIFVCSGVLFVIFVFIFHDYLESVEIIEKKKEN